MSRFTAIFKSSIALGLTTALSKILGVLRDILVAAVLGVGPVASAWTIANLAPNLFRRIFGEGAVGTALVPMLADAIERENGNRQKAAEILQTISFAVGGILTLIVFIGIVIPLGVAAWVNPAALNSEHRLMCEAVPLAMPYAFFICLSGIAMSALNVVKQFFWPGISSLVFNISTIAFLWVYMAMEWNWSASMLLAGLCLSIVLSGVIQWVWLILLLKRHGLWAMKALKALPWRGTLSQLYRLSFPALIGASVLQISVMIDWGIATKVSENAPAALAYADHIALLPVSLVALSLGVVGLSHMTEAAAKNDFAELKRIFAFALRYTLFLAIPMTLFTAVFAREIVEVLFARGRFDAHGVEEVTFALNVLVWGIPPFCAAKIFVSAFHARKEMMTPLKVSMVSLSLNIVLAVTLGTYFKQAGLAAAMVAGSYVYNIGLFCMLRKQLGLLGTKAIMLSVLKTAAAALGALIPCVFLMDMLPRFPFPHLSGLTFPILLCGMLFCGLYALLALLLRCEELSPIVKLLRAYVVSKTAVK